MNKNDVDNKIVSELFAKIRQAEGFNLKTRKYDDDKMRKYIEKLIRDVVEKEYADEV